MVSDVESDRSMTTKRSAIITVPTARRCSASGLASQQMAKLMATEVSPETKDLVDRMMFGRWPGSTPPKKP